MSKPPLDTFYVAATTAAAGWAVYRKVERPSPCAAGRVWVVLDVDGSNTRMTIPRACIKITTRSRTSAARAAIAMTQADRALADNLVTANAQHKLAVDLIRDRYDT